MKEPQGFYRYFPISARDQKWGLYVTTVGETRIPPGTQYPPTGHPKRYAFDWQRGRTLQHYVLIYISSGTGTFEHRPGRPLSIQSGDVILLFPGMWHRYMPNPETGWHERWVGFDGQTARDWEANGFIDRKRAIWSAKAEDLLVASFGFIVEAVKTNRPALQQVMAGATSRIIALLYSAQQSSASTASPRQNVIERAIVRMQAELGDDLDIPTLANELGVGYRWFRKDFARHTGMSPHQYLLELRTLRARNLLTETELRIKEIAAQTGFKDEHYFSRVFRNRVGMSPLEWRSQSRT